MAKRRTLQPWPETVWYSGGRVTDPHILQTIRKRLQRKPFLHWREYTPLHSEESPWWWGFDAAWRTEDGARIKARLELQPSAVATKILNLDRAAVESGKYAVEMGWHLTAEADTPWRLEWPSPVAMLSGVHLHDWASGRLPLTGRFGTLPDMDAQQLGEAIRELSAVSWCITVITHDKRSTDVDPCGEPKLVDYLPPSLLGRVLEVRVVGEQDQLINADGVLPDSKLRLKRGGALILPSTPRQEAWPWADYCVRRPSGGSMDQLLKETAEAVTRYAALPPHYGSSTRWYLEQMREGWELPEIEAAPQRVLQERDHALTLAAELEQQLVQVRAEAEAERKAAQQARQALEEAKAEVQEVRRLPLAQQAQEAERQAREAWGLSELSDAEVERLTGEVAWLRRQLAQVPGRSYGEPVPEPTKGPDTWQELLELAPQLLDHVQVLGSVKEPLQKLYGHASSSNWLRRTWDTLEALNAYVAAKQEHGPAVLPNFATYLEWPQATDLVPRTWFRPSEVSLARLPKGALKQTRMFEVPGLGEVFMGPHVRIGQGSGGLAPRLHFYDDTCGPTGKVHVGYIGPHLPNWKGH